MVPGAMFSIVMSAFFNSSLTISRPRGDLRLSVTDFLLALNWWKYQGSSSGFPGRNLRPGSPVFGFSILTTSAPSQARASVQDGPASNCVKSTIRTPSRQSSSTPIPSIARYSSRKTRLNIPQYSVGCRLSETRAPNGAPDRLGRRIALKCLLQALRIDPDFDPSTLLLQHHRRARVAIHPAAVQRLRELGKRQVGNPHRHVEISAELSGERHVLVR